MIGTHIGSAGDRFTGTALGARHHTTNAWLNATHAAGTAHRSAGADGAELLAGAVVTCLFQAGIGGAGNHLAGAWLIAGHLAGTAGAGAADHLGAVGDAETHLGRFRSRPGTTETVVLLAADVLITGDQLAAAGLVAGDQVAAPHGGTCDTGATQGVFVAHLGGGPASGGRFGSQVLVAGELQA